ncbi:WXG100 family type VII secretion target [Streptomyces sp. NBC_01341]|uniref:WXG100 family type VII secretion target n=1 Tax=Streptomyces sp. NBC_01341 TaxID=2903831 RepID=UPI002E0D4CE7|nr:WXG100 family type VII secretion target [Streptomyces sp. NBC_01341]
MPDYTDGNISVDYRHSNNAAEDLVNQTRAIAGTLEQLELELGELRKTWMGSDAEVYRTKQAAWDGAVKEMELMLSSHAGLLNQVVENYQYSESQLTQLWEEVHLGR